MNNRQIAELLRQVAASYEILGENRFRINAYTQAADSIELLPVDIQGIWKEGKLKDIPGVGGNLAQHLNELFKTGKVKHFEEVFKKMPPGMFDLMKIRTIGPKTAHKLANILAIGSYKGKTIYEQLEKALSLHAIQELEGFGEKREQDIASALTQFQQGQTKKKRLLLSEAETEAQKMCTYLREDKNVLKVDVLGSLRRKKDTIGDIDIAAVSSDAKSTLDHFVRYPEIKTLVDQGPKGATIITTLGIQIDVRIAEDKTYGAMLQYFTGSKYHNIHLREYALSKNYSLSEHGIKETKSEKVHTFSNEKSFYKFLGLDLIPPEIREDKGEIELALQKKLPQLVELPQIRGDLHIHSNYDLKSSHDIGSSPLETLLQKANELQYEYIGLSDHNPKAMGLSAKEIVQILNERKKYFDTILYDKKFVQKYPFVKKVFIMLEVDIRPDGELALPSEAFEYVDAVLVSIHSAFTLDKDKMTQRILKALGTHPKVRVLAHPTGRLINYRESIQAEWLEIFAFCKTHDIALEINASPTRLDLPDSLIFEARKQGIQFIVGTDTHVVQSLEDMTYGISIARRGWCTPHDILNTQDVSEFSKWLLRPNNNLK